MKRITGLLLVISLLVLSCASLTACGTPSDLGACISVYLGEGVYDLDPTDYVVSDNAAQLMGLLFEPLFVLNKNGSLGYGAAKSYKVDKKTRTITVTLRDSYWSDMVKVTAADFLYAWRDVLMEPNRANPAAALLYDIENAVEVKNGSANLYSFGVTAYKSGDKEMLDITYREGADYKQLLKNLAAVQTSPLRQEYVSAASSYWTKKINFSATNGAFAISEYDYEKGAFTLTRNDGYHQEPTVKNPTKKVTPHELVSFVLSDGENKTLTYQDLLDKTVFYLGDAPLADREANRKNATAVDSLSTYTYVFNTENPLFANENVRRALSIAMDRDAIAAAITFGKAATGFLPDSVTQPKKRNSVRTDALLSSSAQIAEANALLASVDFSGMEKTFTLTVEDNEESLKIAELVKASWESLSAGFTVNILPASVTTNQIVDRESSDSEVVKITVYDSAVQATVKDAARGERDFDVIGLDWNMYSTDPFVGLAAFAVRYSGNGALYTGDDNTRCALGSFGGWQSEAYDALIDEAFHAATAKEKAEKLRAAEELLLTSAAVVPLVYNQNFAFVSSDLSRVVTDGFGYFVLTRASQKNYKKYLES